MSSQTADFIIIGGGIAGASAGYGLCNHGRVLILEAEEQLAYHTTGRSAAFYAETYGGPQIQPLTTASKDFFLHAGAGSYLHKRGCMHVAWAGQEQVLERMLADFQASCPHVERLSVQDILTSQPVLKPDGLIGAVYDPECSDIDVHGVHQHFIRGVKEKGGAVQSGCRVLAMRHTNGVWQVETTQGVFEAPIIVNAAGAWGDEMAALAGVAPVGLVPKRRTVITFAPTLEVNPDWPLTLDIEERFYFKPESGRILASPADETPSPACDAQPEDLDIAELIARLQDKTMLDVPRVEAKWAGLRNFVEDKLPVYGFAPDAEGFFWCVGQGGWGIQTAPAAAGLVAELVLGSSAESIFAPR